MICGHLELRDLAAMVRSHWSIMEWVYDVLLIATPMGLVRNEKYEKLLWYCNKVSHILQQSSSPTVIDCDASESDSDDHSAAKQPATHVPPQKPTGQCLPIRLLTIEAYCRERNTTTTGHRKCRAPNSRYLMKYKSHECDVPPIMKGREQLWL